MVFVSFDFFFNFFLGSRIVPQIVDYGIQSGKCVCLNQKWYIISYTNQTLYLFRNSFAHSATVLLVHWFIHSFIYLFGSVEICRFFWLLVLSMSTWSEREWVKSSGGNVAWRSVSHFVLQCTLIELKLLSMCVVKLNMMTVFNWRKLYNLY